MKNARDIFLSRADLAARADLARTLLGLRWGEQLRDAQGSIWVRFEGGFEKTTANDQGIRNEWLGLDEVTDMAREWA